MDRLRILQVIPLFSPLLGGAPEVVRNIARELAKRHGVSVYTTTRYSLSQDFSPSEQLIDGYRLFRFKRNLCTVFIGELNISFSMMDALKKNLRDFDIVHLHSWRQFEDLAVSMLAPKSGVPYILQAHGTLGKASKRGIKQLHESTIGRKILYSASRTIAISPAEANQFASLGVPSNKIKTVYNGLDIKSFSKLPSYGNLRKRLGIDDSTNIILYLGRIDALKGIDFTIDSFAYSIKRLGLSKTILIVCGPDFGFLAKLQFRVRQHGLSEKVLFLGPLSEAEKISAYLDSDMVVYPEKFNVWGLVAMEAAACGKPVIVSGSNYMAEVVKEGKFGFVIDYGDTTSLGSLFKHALGNKQMLNDLGSRGRKFVFEKYDWTNSVLELEQIYKEVISQQETKD
jgi:glycosyltransferase involved in cell wall biosynthesis